MKRPIKTQQKLKILCCCNQRETKKTEMTLSRSESGFTALTPPSSPATADVDQPTKKSKKHRKRKREAKSRGDSPHLKEWREYFKAWVARNTGSLEGVRIVDRAKLAGIAYRHSKGKKRSSDPEKPELV